MTAGSLDQLLLSPATRQLAKMYLDSPNAALLITGAEGSGRYTLAKTISANLLQDKPETLPASPNFIAIQVPQGQSEISIDSVRTLRRRLTLKNITAKPRLVLLENAHKMSDEAQNALLKILEEPPVNTTFILTASTSNKLLPTIVSRTWGLSVRSVSLGEACSFYKDYSSQEIERAWNLSGGLPGLLNALLHKEESHPLKDAVDRAKQFISSSVYERLIQVDQEIANPAELQLFLEALSKVMAALHRQAVAKNESRKSLLLKNRQLIFRLQHDLEYRANARLLGLQLALNLKT